MNKNKKKKLLKIIDRLTLELSVRESQSNKRYKEAIGNFSSALQNINKNESKAEWYLQKALENSESAYDQLVFDDDFLEDIGFTIGNAEFPEIFVANSIVNQYIRTINTRDEIKDFIIDVKKILKTDYS